MAGLTILPFCLFANIFIGTLRLTFGRGTGAPTSACVSMTPGHTGTTPETTTSPYNVSVSSTTYTAGMTITVTVKGMFKGILLQGRKVTGTETPVGQFMNPPSGFKLMKCTNDDDAITHTSDADKDSISVTWKSPMTGMDDLVIMATVAEAQAKYWVKLKSETIKFETNSATSGTNISQNPDSAMTTTTNGTGTENRGSTCTKMKESLIWTAFTAFLVALF